MHRLLGRQSDLLHRVRGLRLLFYAAFGSGLGSWMAFVALNLDVWDRTHSGSWIAALLIADFLPAIAIGLTVGPLVDRLSRRRVMVSADVVRFLVFCTLPFAASAGQIVALAAVAGGFGNSARDLMRMSWAATVTNVLRWGNRSPGRAARRAGMTAAPIHPSTSIDCLTVPMMVSDPGSLTQTNAGLPEAMRAAFLSTRPRGAAVLIGIPREDAVLELEGVDGVFHLAGQPGVKSFGGVFPLYVRRNLFASQRLFEAAAAAGLDDEEISETIASGLEAGKKMPPLVESAQAGAANARVAQSATVIRMSERTSMASG
jgi:MFS family permease